MVASIGSLAFSNTRPLLTELSALVGGVWVGVVFGESSMASVRRSLISSEVEEGGWGEGREEEEEVGGAESELPEARFE